MLKKNEFMQKKSCIFAQFAHWPMRRKRKRQHSHAPTPAARGELHFNELLILVCAPVIITDLMNIYAPCLKLLHMRNRRRFRAENISFPTESRPLQLPQLRHGYYHGTDVTRDGKKKLVIACILFKSSVIVFFKGFVGVEVTPAMIKGKIKASYRWCH